MVPIASSSRRRFLASLGGAGATLATASWLDAIGYAQGGRGPARAFVQQPRARTDFDRRVLGAFLEHLGRAVYTGVYQPGSPLADSNGFRSDVAREVKELGVPIVRYPGGNFVSGYNWLDGVGPKAQRPTVLERAWNSIETNQFGTNEFIDWCRQVGTEPLLGMNFGTGTAEMAVAYVEYCNFERGTKWSELRRSHGYEKPHNVRYWCLGNEMDGPWQIGQMQAREYGRKARDAARQMRGIDPTLELIACGSSGTGMPQYLVWDREVLEECYDQVDGISLHAYYGNTQPLTGNSTARYLAMNLDMDRQIREVAAVCDYVQGLRRSSKRLWLSFDEWNVWYRARSGDAVNGRRQFAPKLLEEVYNLEDALLVGGFVNTLLRNAERVRVGCLAQLVNVIAPLVTSDTGVLRQSTYFPYAWALQLRARACARPPRRGRHLSHPCRRAAGRFRPQRSGAVRGRRRHAGFAERTGVRADAEPGSGWRARARAGVARRHADAGLGVRDADGTGSEGVQHLRAAAAGGAAAARRAGCRRAHDVQVAGPVLHRGADRDDGIGRPHRCTNAAKSGRSLRSSWRSPPFPW